MQPLGDYASLCLIQIARSPSSDGHVSFLLSRLIGQQYHVGPEGVTIGTSTECSVCVPPESGTWPTHTRINWNIGEYPALSLLLHIFEYTCSTN